MSAAPKYPAAIPTLDELARDPSRASDLAADALAALAAHCAAVQSVLAAAQLARIANREALSERSAGLTVTMVSELTNRTSDIRAASGKFNSLASSLSATKCYLSVKQLAARIPYAEKTPQSHARRGLG